MLRRHGSSGVASVSGQLLAPHVDAQDEISADKGLQLGRFGLFRKRKAESQTGATCFPSQLHMQSSQVARRPQVQELVSVGSRQWGSWWDGRALLRVKIYDFAVYMDAQQAKQSRLTRSLKGRLEKETRQPQFYKQLRSSDDIEMSLMVRASRNLPIRMMAAEYERILKRRLQNVGGSPQDPGLLQMLDCFREEALPASMRQGGSVRKGTVFTFSRSNDGHLIALANDTRVLKVQSPKLCQAVFDLYLGDNPVSKKAKAEVGSSVVRLIEEGEAYQPPKVKGVCSVAAGDGCRL
ncbi:hypothetical protein WJX72_012447 [[Myrmecia] bisecta]|uniref:Chalcone isomerase domain-containing protein n=1 Tax=[Myrmecia] bisecta TaxID=41462 RepID=A0AAW1RAS5_9CHLO